MKQENKDILKKYVCLNPFKYIDIQQDTQWVCCPSWCPTNIRQNNTNFSDTETLKQSWFSQTVKDIRESVTDGTYKFCDHKVCPQLSQLINTGVKPKDFITIEEFQKSYDLENYSGLPEQILFGFDRSCNLKCPSCRKDFVPNDDPESESHKTKKYLLDAVDNEFSESAKVIMITGSGDPFYSKLYRDYLINFDASKYPNLERIHIITNGVLLTEKMWDKLKAKPFIKTMEISIDAGTKHTYENITRLNGDWDALIENLNFLKTQTTLEHLTLSMVVSQYNYKEMEMFYNLMLEIFEKASFTFSINYRQIVHWNTGAYTIKDINNISIFDPTHPQFKDFLTELHKINNKSERINHNFHHLL